jgi:ABC-type uncharacterized transport system permease subunit
MDVVILGAVPLSSMRFGLCALSLWVILGWTVLHRRPQMESLRSLLVGLALVLLGIAQVAPDSGGSANLSSPWFLSHVALILTGLGALAVSFTLSVLWLLVRRRLKLKKLRGISRLPTLDTLDRLNYQSMVLGFVSLTAGMAVGGMWAAINPDAQIGADITIWGTLLLWCWYAVGLHTRLVSGWRGRLAAVFGVGGFVWLGAMVTVAGLVLQGWH